MYYFIGVLIFAILYMIVRLILFYIEEKDKLKKQQKCFEFQILEYIKKQEEQEKIERLKNRLKELKGEKYE